MTKIAIFAFLLLLSCCLHWQGGMSQEDFGRVEDNGGERGSVDFGGVDGGSDGEADGESDSRVDGGADSEEGSVDGETAENADEDGDGDTSVDSPQSIAAATDEKAKKGPVGPICPMVRRCAAGWSRMRDSRGCYRCYYISDCRRYGCPKGYYCRASLFSSLPAYTCVRRLRCPRISKPLFSPRNVCLRCQKSCNCMKCRPGYVCCRDWFGCVKCVRGIPY